MKQYFKKFWFLYAIVVALLIVYLVLSIPNGAKGRANTECLTEERVFDYADMLTDAQEDSLRGLIAEKEEEAGCDIVLVVMNEELESGYSLMEYADDFYDENKFGYNKPNGDGVVLVDNWYNDGTYNGETWFSTSGKAESKYSDYEIDELLDYVCDVVNEDAYEAYRRYVNKVARDLTVGSNVIEPGTILLVALFLAVAYLFLSLTNHKGKKTTNAYTYVENGAPTLNSREDIFITKRVTSRKIDNGSSGGGGGHHRSSGGHSHGGGGRRH